VGLPPLQVRVWGQARGRSPCHGACLNELSPGERAAWAPVLAAAAAMQLSAQPGRVREDERPALCAWTALPPPPAVRSPGLYPQALHLCPAPGGSLLTSAPVGRGRGLPCLHRGIPPGCPGGWGAYTAVAASDLAPHSKLEVDK